MPYLIILFLSVIFISVVFIFFISIIKKENNKIMLTKSKISNTVNTIISEGGKYALIMYHHDPHDEEQLGWALSNSKHINHIDKQNRYFYNIGSEILSKQLENGTFIKLKNNEYMILTGYPNDTQETYLFIIKKEKENIIFNALISL